MLNAKVLVGDLKDQSEVFKRPEIKISNDLKERERLKHNAVLFANARGALLVNSHLVFAKNYNTSPESVYSKLQVFRSYWLGGAWTNLCPRFDSEQEAFDYISNILVNDLVEMAASYRVNFDRLPATQILAMKEKHTLPLPSMYREWFKKMFGHATYTGKLIPLLAEKKSIKEIEEILPANPTDVPVFDGLFHAPILYKHEVEKVLDLLSKNPEPLALQQKRAILSDISRPLYHEEVEKEDVNSLAQLVKEQQKQIEDLKSLMTNKKNKGEN